MPLIFRVSELTRAVKEVVEGQFPFVWVRGQVSNLARPGSGHIYFTLKDEQASLSVVWFKNAQLVGKGLAGQGFDPLTGEVFESATGSAWLADGQEVLAAGRLTVYPPRGVYQLSAEMVEELGAGKLYLEFEALKKELAEKGYFDASRKMRLPDNPARVAVITSPSGAAIRDFIKVGQDRGFEREVRLYPVLVQGERAPAEIARALARVCRENWAQAVVLIRGGGSLEDLWAFNTRAVAEAIFACSLPVLCGVGHEVDTSIADLVADVRAATPSQAAEMLWPKREILAQRLDEAELTLCSRMRRYLAAREQLLDGLDQALSWLSPLKALARRELELAELEQRILRQGAKLVSRSATRFEELARRLARAFGPGAWRERETLAENLSARLDRAKENLLALKGSRLALAEARLLGLDPEAPLTRGYSLTTLAVSGRLVRSPKDAPAGSELEIRLREGKLKAVSTS